jgi:hypothetical protein
MSKPLHLAIIHTTPVTIEPLKSLAAEYMPGCRVVNVMDDSILLQLAENGGDVEAVKDRLCTYAFTAERLGVDCILNACSSVGEVVAEMRNRVTIPVVRIDEAMAERVVQLGRRIGVVATLNTTLRPTLALLEAKAAEANKPVEFLPSLAETAYRRLMADDKDGHDEELSALAAERLVVTTMKRARQGKGFIVRLQNIGGTDEVGALSFTGKRIGSAWRTDLLERELEPILHGSNGELRIEVPAWGLTTVRFELESSTEGEIT